MPTPTTETAVPPSQAQFQFRRIAKPVGAGCPNCAEDVAAVQELLSIAHSFRQVPKRRLAIDSKADLATVRAITEFQLSFLSRADGRVEPGSETLAKLNQLAREDAATH